jgi:hypothetical protein
MEPDFKFINVMVYDCTGKCVYSHQVEPEQIRGGILEINLRTLTKGMYTVSINEQYNAKIIKL